MTISDESLPKEERLIKTRDFRKVYNKGCSSRIGAFILRAAPNNLDANRIGFSISSRSVPKAHRRNRIKRLFREVFRKNKRSAKSGFDMVLIVRKDPGEKFGYVDAAKIFLNLSGKAGLSCSEA